jgi:hypothetical protein
MSMTMTNDEILKRLAAIRKMDLKSLEAIAGEIADDGRRPLVMLSRLATSVDAPEPRKARLILEKLAELSILPWLAASRNQLLPGKLDSIALAYRAYAAIMQTVLIELDRMMARKKLLEPPVLPGPVEEPPPTLRECDEGALLFRRLRNPDETWRQYAIARGEFGRLSESERDAEIESYRRQIKGLVES